MSEIPAVNGKQAISAFAKNGFRVVRTSGSHHVMKKDGHPYVLSVPVHGNQSLKAGTLRGLIRASGITIEEFIESLG